MLLLLGPLVPLCSAQSTLPPGPADLPVYTTYAGDTGACGNTGGDTAEPLPPLATADTADTADTAPPMDTGDGTVAGPGYLVDCGCSSTTEGVGRLSLIVVSLLVGVVARRRRC